MLQGLVSQLCAQDACAEWNGREEVRGREGVSGREEESEREAWSGRETKGGRGGQTREERRTKAEGFRV